MVIAERLARGDAGQLLQLVEPAAGGPIRRRFPGPQSGEAFKQDAAEGRCLRIGFTGFPRCDVVQQQAGLSGGHFRSSFQDRTLGNCLLLTAGSPLRISAGMVIEPRIFSQHVIEANGVFSPSASSWTIFDQKRMRRASDAGVFAQLRNLLDEPTVAVGSCANAADAITEASVCPQS